MDLVVLDTAIRRDAAGRYCINDLHRASGAAPKDRPGHWLATGPTKALVAEVQGDAGLPAPPVAILNDGANNGTYVVKELVYAYAMWISPAFHLRVIRAFDSLQAGALTLPRTMSEALRLAADEAERRERAEQALAIAAPKIEAHDRLIAADGSLCLRDAAKNLGVRQNAFIEALAEHRWLYRAGDTWRGHADAVAKGYLTHRPHTYTSATTQTERITDQVKVTAAGLSRLSVLLARWGVYVQRAA